MKTFSKIQVWTAAAVAAAIILPAGAALAHTIDNPREDFMRQMMGDAAFDAMEAVEEQMMGAENHERMEELMDKMFAGGLSLVEQNEMISIMRDAAAGPGAQNMMTRMMWSQMMLNSGFGSGMMGFGGGFGFVFWVTTVLIWTVLVLAIIALIRWLGKK